MRAESNYLVEMTVRAGVHENTWGMVDYTDTVQHLVALIKRYLPFLLITTLVVGTILFAMSCNGSTVAFSSDSKVASLNIEVAATPSAQNRGLMGRKELAKNSAMLFDFGGITDTAFYMKDTSIPLSVAFIDSSGKVLAIKNMKPFDLTPVRSPDKYRYALETNQGWFEEHGIKPGNRATVDL